MATNRRPYAAVPDEVYDDPAPAAIRLAFMALSVIMHRRWRNSRLTLSEAGTIQLNASDLALLGGGGDGAAIVEALPQWAEILVECDDRGVYTVTWPKWIVWQAEVSGLDPKTGKRRSKAPAKGKSSGNGDPKETRRTPEDRPNQTRASPEPRPPVTGHEQEQEQDSRIPERARARGKVASFDSQPSEAQDLALGFGEHLRQLGLIEEDRPTELELAHWANDARITIEVRRSGEPQALATWVFLGLHKDAQWWQSRLLSVDDFRRNYDRIRAQWLRSLEDLHGPIDPFDDDAIDADIAATLELPNPFGSRDKTET